MACKPVHSDMAPLQLLLVDTNLCTAGMDAPDSVDILVVPYTPLDKMVPSRDLA